MKRRKRIAATFNYLILIIGAVFILVPLYITIVNSFKTQAQSSQSFFTLPSSLKLENFQSVLSDPYFFSSLKNTAILTFISIFVIIFMTPMVAYAINRNSDKKFFKFLLYYITSAMFVPFQVVALPLAIFMSKLNLSNNFGAILVYITYAMIMGVYLCAGYMKTIPNELAESTYIDGASNWTAFFKVIFPLMKPMTATIVIINFLWIWNEFLIALVLLNKSQAMQTLTLYIYRFKGQYSSNFNLMFATVLMSIIPITIVYCALQKHIVAGLTGGAIKN